MALESQRLRELNRLRFAVGDTAWQNIAGLTPQQQIVPPAPPVGYSPAQVASTPQYAAQPMRALPSPTVPATAGPAIPMGTGAPTPTIPSGPARLFSGADSLRAVAGANGAGGGRIPPVIPSGGSPAAPPPRPPGGNPAGAPFRPDSRAAAQVARGVRPSLPFNSAGGVGGAARQTFANPGLRGGARNLLGIGLPIHLLRGATDDAASQGSLLDRFLEGAATGGEAGSVFGPAGAAVGALGMGLGDTLAGVIPGLKDKETSSQILTRLTGGILGGGGGQQEEGGGQALTFESLTPLLDTAGITGEGRASLQREYNLTAEMYKAAGMWNDETKMALQQQTIERVPALMQEQEAQQKMLQNQMAQQALVSEYFGGENGLVERMRQSGQARGDAMAALSGSLPAHLAPAANFMATDARAQGDSLAAAYEAQLRLLPTMNAMTQYQQDIQGIASQVLNSGVQTALTGGAGGATNPLADPTAAMAQDLLAQMGG